MKLFMETTKIDASKTVAEIQSLLGKYGCSGVMTLYEKNEVKAVAFQIMFLDKNVAFNLPCRWECIYKNFVDRRASGYDRPVHRAEDDAMQAKRVAWRQILRWVEAQLALVETNMVKIQEVFLPYMQMNIKGQTLYESVEKQEFKMLGHIKD
jgi:hypothetical protein